jgi:thymidylate synthase
MLTYRTCGEAWVGLLVEALVGGEMVEDDKGPLFEISPQLFEISATTNRDALLERFGTLAVLADYREKYLGNRVLPRFSYSYGARLFSGEPSAWDLAIKLLQRKPWSKSAWIPIIEAADLGKAVPCLAGIGLRIRSGQSIVTAAYRSQNIMHCYLNYLPLSELQIKAANELGVEAGPLRVYIESPHLYELDLGAARTILEAYSRPGLG